MICTSKIVKIVDGKGFWTFTPLKETYLIEKQHPSVQTLLTDGRTISQEQRKHIWAVINDISQYSGHESDYLHSFCLKPMFCESTGHNMFSLSDCDMTVASEYLQYVIEFCIENEIPTRTSLLNIAPETSKFVYACLMKRKCCISGLEADIHHVDSVGAGRNRETICHIGMRVLPLNRRYHSEAHTIGDYAFMRKYNLVPIKLDEYTCKQLGLNTKAS